MFVLAAPILLADVTHVVQRGHTIEAIAHRYHVSEKAITQANHLKDSKHLKPGQVLVIPGVEEGSSKKKERERTTEKMEKLERDKGAHRDKGHLLPHIIPTVPQAGAASRMPDAAVEPREGGQLETIVAVRSGEQFHIRLKDKHGHISASAVSAFERMMRQGSATHAPDPRLIALVGIVSSHFGDKPIEVVSGYRAYTATQYTPHSNHNLGRALDFRIRGVNNLALSDFCRTLRNAGCGYYPNGSFVHLDVRDTKAFWIDRAGPGEAPKYVNPDGLPDESASDVPKEAEVEQDASLWPEPPAAAANPQTN